MTHAISSPAIGELSIWSVLGLSGQGSEEWARLRGLQYSQLALVARARIWAQALAAIVSVLLFAPYVSHPMIGGWLGALCASLTYSVRNEGQLSDADRRGMSSNEFRRQAMGTIINAMVWASPLLFFLPQAPVHLRYEFWTVLAMLMTVSAVIVPTVPLSTLLFSTIVGCGSVVGFFTLLQPGMAGVAALFVASIALGTIEASRHFLASRLAVAGMAERNEVVSLLLREFDEDEADWLWQTDAQRRVRAVSTRFAEAMGMAPSEIEGSGFLSLLLGPGGDPRSGEGRGIERGTIPGLMELEEKFKARESFSNLLVRVMVQGTRRYWSLSGAPRFDDVGAFMGFRGVASDVTEQQETSEKIAYLARYDTLTGLPNRMMVIDALENALVAAREGDGQCAFLMIDLDRFKAVNDTLGHPVGDQLLSQVAERLKVLMTHNSLCGRLGGDEFCVVLRQANERTLVARLAQAIIADLSQPYFVDGHELTIGASVGSAFGPVDGGSVPALMRNADFALYRAKRNGRGMHSAFDEALRAEAEARAWLEEALRAAVERQEFEMFYQPVVDARSERLVGFESLLRWNSPELGRVSPDRFLSLAEDTRLSLPIGAWVLKEACHQVAQWPGNLRVSVNVSDKQALDPAFIDHVVTALAVSNLAPQRLEIEVTESLFQRDPALARATIERLTALGCSVILDDFGAGQASVAILCEMRFDAIKLDRALMKGAASGNAESMAMIRAAVAIADSLEMITIAKGVETPQELEIACKLGCRRLQGLAYGDARGVEEVQDLFGTRPVPVAQEERAG
ncbi:diguanylate cyclase (GGDEF)-like protein [Novosphingobium sp. SG751A]|uniref:putative bifunctional diguanylate cyclase/phosphodiesterase n=1 Tax=Novosphingobium sp. SG751A TaxID=2587000 RepID=UPI001553ED0E|nr:EAL domain-containing protein [Novosphingobium sp. SG751A]NOW46917.1 diguanylate cyclase (GGDEF)-like protein [Novosphingobium sp. SG751A]